MTNSKAPFHHGLHRRWIDIGLLAVLTLLVWGLFAPDRGLWRDDAMLLSGAAAHDRHIKAGDATWTDILSPLRVSSTRRLYFVPYFSALRTGHPRIALQLLYGLVWLGTGLAALWLAARIRPTENAVMPLVAGVLTVCATGDSYAMSLGSLTPCLSVLSFVVALAAAFSWIRGGRAGWLILSSLALSASIWNTDIALTSLLLSPLIFLVAGPPEPWRPDRRTLVAMGVWLVTALPYLIVFVSDFVDTSTYVNTRGFVRPTAAGLASQAGLLFGHNFLPWRWAFDRPVFEWVPPRTIPWWVGWSSALVGVGLVLARVRRLDRGTPRLGSLHRWPWLVGVFLVLALAVNTMYSMVRLSRFIHRTQLMSQVWASLALAVVVARLLEPGRGSAPRRLLGYAILVVFVVCGILGGVERQDYYLSIWRTQKAGLESVVRQAPALDPEATLIFSLPPSIRGAAVYNTYIARHWMMLLYDDSSLTRRTFVISRRGGACRPDASALLCWDERRSQCVVSGECEATEIPYDEAVVFTYSHEDRELDLAHQLPRELRPAGVSSASTGYAPTTLVVDAPPTPLAEDLLGGGLLGRWLPTPPPDPPPARRRR